jgi:hypothetical protein
MRVPAVLFFERRCQRQTNEYISKLIITMIFIGIPFFCNAQSRRAPEIRSCLASEIALASMENTNPKKGWDENYDEGKRLGYVIAEFYQRAIWAMDEPEIEGREVVMSAFQSAQQRMKYMKIDALKRDVERCRASFN